MKIGFADGEKLGVFENGEKKIYQSQYITKYKENALRTAKSKEWKKNSDRLLADEFYFEEDEPFLRSIVNCVSPTIEENTLVYSFSVGETSGIYYKDLSDKEQTESHALSSSDVEFTQLCVAKDGKMLGAVQTDGYCSNIVMFQNGGSEYQTLTGGDSFDENPTFRKNGKILFNSYAIGRDQNNAFVTYLPSEIYQIDPETLEIEEKICDSKFSYIKPIEDGNGNVYCIRKPHGEEPEENAFLQILMIPVRIVQAIVGFVSAFVACFAKKPLVSGTSAQSSMRGEAAKGLDRKKAWINNHLVNVEKELERNKKSEEYGFIPKSWLLVRLEQDETGKFVGEYELARGVADYCVVEEEGRTLLVYTNGKRVFALTEEKEHVLKKKLFDVDFCVKVNALQ